MPTSHFSWHNRCAACNSTAAWDGSQAHCGCISYYTHVAATLPRCMHGITELAPALRALPNIAVQDGVRHGLICGLALA